MDLTVKKSLYPLNYYKNHCLLSKETRMETDKQNRLGHRVLMLCNYMIFHINWPLTSFWHYLPTRILSGGTDFAQSHLNILPKKSLNFFSKPRISQLQSRRLACEKDRISPHQFLYHKLYTASFFPPRLKLAIWI